MPAQILDFDSFSKRVVLPTSMAVTATRRGEVISQLPLFGDEDHERSMIVREVLDSFAFEFCSPKPKPKTRHERIFMEGAVITNSLEIAGKIVRQTRRSAAPDLEALAIEAQDHPIRQAAQDALQRLAASKPKRQAAKPAKRRRDGLWMRILDAVQALKDARGDHSAH